MNKENLLSAMMKIVYNNKNIVCLLETGERVNTTISKDSLMGFKLILGVKDLNEIALLESMKEIIESSFILQKEDGLSMMNNYFGDVLRYIAVIDDLTIVDFTFFKYDDVQSYIDVDSLCKIHIDKNNGLVGNVKITDVKYRQLKPTQKEFLKCCNEFFIYALKIARGLYRSEIIYSMNLFTKLKARLDKMTLYYIGCQYDFSVNIGAYDKNMKTYLEKSHYEKLLETYPSPDKDKLWTALFNACMLFRKEGLHVSEKLEYLYPKEADREIVKYLREVWNMYAQ
ncbi:MAG: aminoglycoside 6-adenylyltransferase [Miniphocaeibacter sp.]|uniref:aminoglycoside 6-adenylyltransferase n=1 Tax=Miniphocaeibacter sp. TaxID=3100973 RepID=UPI001855BFAC|nr:aminoglycoside 6-adenylyltransferase [Gallicola sp.]